MGYPNTSNFVINTPLCIVFSTLFSMFGYPDETLSLVFDLLPSIFQFWEFSTTLCNLREQSSFFAPGPSTTLWWFDSFIVSVENYFENNTWASVLMESVHSTWHLTSERSYFIHRTWHHCVKEYEPETFFFFFIILKTQEKDGAMALTSHGIFVMMAFFMVSSLIL